MNKEFKSRVYVMEPLTPYAMRDDVVVFSAQSLSMINSVLPPLMHDGGKEGNSIDNISSLELKVRFGTEDVNPIFQWTLNYK